MELRLSTATPVDRQSARWLWTAFRTGALNRSSSFTVIARRIRATRPHIAPQWTMISSAFSQATFVQSPRDN